MEDPPEAAAGLADRLLAAAGEILDGQGLDAVTLRAVAHRAGTTTMAVYSRLGGKDGLMDALARQGYRLLAREQERALAEPDPTVRLLRMCRAWRTLARDHPGHFRVMAMRAATTGEEAMAAFLRLVAAAGEVAGMRRAERLARALHALCQGVLMLELSGGLPGGRDGGQVLEDGLRWLIAGAFSDAAEPEASPA
ncbi:MAG: TetR/AcrR family transcriptional regulator [Alphaproteobacteria bacterium]|nr:MAG: TetR/AcrR family transcriptional regulator [Alphaproteobacteria bacterium]